MGDPSPDDDRALRDLRWCGYDPRAAVPQMCIAAAVSAGLLFGRLYFDDFADAFVIYTLAVAVWPGLLGAAAYRAVTYTYRITDRALFVDRGMFFLPVPPVWFSEVASVEASTGWLRRKLDVGAVRLTTTTGRVVRLSGVRHPNQFAELVKKLLPEAQTAAR